MDDRRRFHDRIIHTLIEHRWLLLLLLTAAAFLFELWENLVEQEPVDIHVVREMLFYGVLFPVATFLLLNGLLKAQEERNSIASQQERSRQLKEKLSQAKDVATVHQTIVTFPESFAPVLGAVLFLPVAGKAALERVVERWPMHPERPFPLPTTIPYDFCGATLHQPNRGLHPFVSPHPAEEAGLHGYCLPLFRGEVVVGLLHLYLPASKNLTADQINILNQTAAAMVLALGTAVPPNVEVIQAAAASDERKRIARHLHDTIGQSLAYLQLKLTELSGEDIVADMATFHRDLERMRDISNEVYEQVRQSVLMMQTDNNIDLTKALIDQAKSTARQAELGLNYILEGQPQVLPPLIQRKILFIFREALNNVQRHAQATAVQLTIIWDADAVTVELSDNGIGFNSQNGAAHGHFGLLIMAQRAEEINAHLSVTAVPGRGAKVSLWYPYALIHAPATASAAGVNGHERIIPE